MEMAQSCMHRKCEMDLLKVERHDMMSNIATMSYCSASVRLKQTRRKTTDL